MGLRNLKVGDVLQLRGNQRVLCRVIARDDIGHIVEVFPFGTKPPVLSNTRALVVMRVNGAALRRDFERVAHLPSSERPLPRFQRDLGTIFLAPDVTKFARRTWRPSPLKFTQDRKQRSD